MLELKNIFEIITFRYYISSASVNGMAIPANYLRCDFSIILPCIRAV